jgi:hypothetical protein
MSESSGQGEPGNRQTNDDNIIMGWEVKPNLIGAWVASPVTRRKTDAERAMANMFMLAEKANNPEDCLNNLERALQISREYGIELSPPPIPPPGGGPTGHQARMDAWRIVITLILVLGVLAIVAWSLSLRNASSAAQYAAPISGLAGIGLGWLFTNQSPISSKKEQDT